MIELKGKYNTAKVFNDNVDAATISQIIEMCNQPFVAGKKIRIMPDTHAGAGCTIGTTMEITDYVVPNWVGVDIACFSGDTMVSLLDGTEAPMIELSNRTEPFWVYSVDKEGNIVPGLAVCNKIKENQALIEVEISGGEKIRCTQDHLFLMRDGYYKHACDLQHGDSLFPLYRGYDKDGYEVIYRTNGENLHRARTNILVAKATGLYKDGCDVHHRDENKTNNCPDNLEPLTKSQHSLMHIEKSGRKDYFATEDFKRKKKLTISRRGYFYTEAGRRMKIEKIRGNLDKVREKYPKLMRDVYAENAKRGGKMFAEKNSDPLFRLKQRAGKYRKILLKIQELGLQIDRDSYEANKNCVYNASSYEMFQEFCFAHHLTPDLILSGGEAMESSMMTNHRVVGVYDTNTCEDTYCLTVEKWHNFALSAGVFVHNCGMTFCKIPACHADKIDLPKLDDIIHQYVPSGMAVHDEELSDAWLDELLNELHCKNFINISRAKKSVGTLGGGNHFIELDRSVETGDVYLVVHCGSRYLGKQIAEHYQDVADINAKKMSLEETMELKKMIDKLKASGQSEKINQTITDFKNQHITKYPKGMAPLSGQDAQDYLHDAEIANHFAHMNREAIMTTILRQLGFFGDCTEQYEDGVYPETLHNYIEIFKGENNSFSGVLRKGAISAKAGELVLIPMNMRDGSLLCIGKGNEDWNCSAPHGAGRILSRSQAKNTINLDAYEKAMEGIYSTSVCQSTIDESPMAYKNAEDIEQYIGETVAVVEHLKPIYNFKASE